MASAEVAALLATFNIKSLIVTTVESTVVVVPVTCKFPAITTKPDTPSAAGSIVITVLALRITSVPIVMLPVFTLPPVMLPVTDNDVSIPTLVMLG